MSDRTAAYEDWKSGMKPAALAEKYGVPVNTVKSWVARSKKEEGAKKNATSKPKRMHPGAPLGNQNAKGNPGGGAPKGNTNNLRHGFYWNCFTEEEQDLLSAQGEISEEERLLDELKLWMARERRLMNCINEQRAIASGLAVESVTREGEKTSTTAGSTFERILKLNTLLTAAQRGHARCIEALHNMRKDDGESGDGNLPALQATLDQARIARGDADD